MNARSRRSAEAEERLISSQFLVLSSRLHDEEARGMNLDCCEHRFN